MSGADRTVHARAGVVEHATGVGSLEIVRYDRAGKWYLEGGSLPRTPLTLHEAARKARYWMDCTETGRVFFGRPGGGRFDAAVRAAGR